ncbi:thymidine phosphorylase [Acholeplasma granularum]|uniref:thymidine phosphorylase n=1 Tax=Acholeplasma granularum TaxID=264635 RepID=UPI00046F350B|nr:thymidine phosphorylase [Acholeplasma granularum]
MQMVDLINKKKYGDELSHDEIKFIIDGYTKGLIPDYQMSAFLMSVYFNGMTTDESTALALAMRDSGDVLDLSDITGTKVDKHSTGGVGDKVSIVLAPLVAYLGAKLAKMSGRGLGHTGGTIDKLESIPGFQVELPLGKFKDQVNEIGCAIVGQSGDIAPADKLIYALRDVTATVDSIPLIASSIMSKKLASGADAIVLDVKVGSGAFMKTLEDARKLSKLMVEIGKKAGKKVSAILTSMEEPLGYKIGNALEIYESIETLEGHGPEDLTEIVCVITGHLLKDSGVVKDYEAGYKLAYETLKSGAALPKFYEFVKAQNGDVNFLKNKDEILTKTKQHKLYAKADGYLEKVDALKVGLAGMKLGAGRATKEDKINLFVGIDLHIKIGDKIKKGDLICTLYHDEKGLVDAIELIESSYIIGPNKRHLKLVEEMIV